MASAKVRIQVARASVRAIIASARVRLLAIVAVYAGNAESFIGRGILALAAIRKRARSVSLSGSGTLTPASNRRRNTSVAMVGTGTLNLPTSIRRRISSVAFIGSGIFSPTGGKAGVGNAVNFVGTGTFLTTFLRKRIRSASFLGVGTMLLAAIRRRARSVALIGTGTLTAVAQRIRARSVALIGTGTLSFGAIRRRARSVAFVGTGTLIPAPLRRRARSISLVGIGTLAPTALRRRARSVALVGTGTLSLGSQKISGGGGGTVTFVQAASDSADAGNPLDVTLTGVVSGNAITIGVGWETASSTYTGVTESGGTGSASTWVPITANPHNTGGEPIVMGFYTLNAQMSGNVTYTINTGAGAPSFMRLAVAEFSYTGGTLSFDVSNVTAEGSSSGTLTSGTITTTGASGAEIVFAYVKGFTAITFTSPQIGGSAATIAGTNQSDTAMWYRVTTLSSGTATISASASDKWVLSIWSFKVS